MTIVGWEEPLSVAERTMPAPEFAAAVAAGRAMTADALVALGFAVGEGRAS